MFQRRKSIDVCSPEVQTDTHETPGFNAKLVITVYINEIILVPLKWISNF